MRTAGLECALCSVPMTVVAPRSSPIRYHHCPSCSRWCASPYGGDMVRAGTTRDAATAGRAPADPRISELRERLDRWLETAEAGVTPRAPSGRPYRSK